MILDTAEAKCVIQVLKILERGESKYSIMFKETKASHTTLQGVLRELVSKKLIVKKDIGHMNVDYSITENGEKLCLKLNEISKLLN